MAEIISELERLERLELEELESKIIEGIDVANLKPNSGSQYYDDNLVTDVLEAIIDEGEQEFGAVMEEGEDGDPTNPSKSNKLLGGDSFHNSK